MQILIENQGGHGAIPLNRIHRFYHKKVKRDKLVRGFPFDWNKGYDVRNIIGSISIKNQGSNSSCSGQAGSYFLEIQNRLRNINEGQLSAKSIYAPIAFPGGGTTIASLMTQLSARGANLEKTIPSVFPDGSPLPEPQIAERSWQTEQLREDAENRAGYTPYDISEDIDEVAATIRDYGAVIMEITGQNNGTWTTSIPKPPSKTNSNPTWNHFMCLCGAKLIDGKKYIIALQSEGTSWGDSGIQYFGEDYFNSGYIRDCFTFIYDSKLKPNDNTIDIWAELWRYFVIWKKQVS